MANKAKDKAFRDLHEALTEWTCQYCQGVAITIRQGAAVCSRHKHLWVIGSQTATLEAPPPLQL